jgi:hypothetical protein
MSIDLSRCGLEPGAWSLELGAWRKGVTAAAADATGRQAYFYQFTMYYRQNL